MTSINSFCLLASHWRRRDSRNVRLAATKIDHLAIPPADDRVTKGMVHTVHLRDTKTKCLTYCRVADDPCYQSTLRVNIAAEQQGDGKPEYCVEMENGEFKPLTDILNEFDSKPIVKKFEQFEQACKDAGFPAFHPVPATNIQQYHMVFEDSHLFKYSSEGEERTFYRFNDQSGILLFNSVNFAGLKEENMERALDMFTAQSMLNNRLVDAHPFFVGNCGLKGQNVSQSCPAPRDAKIRTTSLETQRSLHNKPLGPFFDQNKLFKDCKKGFIYLFEDLLAFVDLSLTSFFNNWRMMANEATIHQDKKDFLQEKLNRFAIKSLKPLKWLESRWIKPLVEVLKERSDLSEDPRIKNKLTMQIMELLECFKNASNLCSFVDGNKDGELASLAQDLPLNQFFSYVEESKIGFSEYEYKLFDSSHLREILNSSLDNPEILKEFQTKQENELKVMTYSLLKKRAPERSESRNSEKWDDHKKAVQIGFQLGGMIISSLKNSLSRNLEVMDIQSGKLITKIDSSTSYSFDYSGYLISIEQKKISWRRPDSPEETSRAMSLLGMGHWTRPFKVGSSIFYLCHDQQKNTEDGQYEVLVNLILVDLTPLSEGKGPAMRNYCEVLKGIRATCCDLVASEYMIAISIDSFMGDRFLCLVPIDKTQQKVEPIVHNLKQAEPFKSFAEANTAIKGESFHLEIKAMQFFNEQLFVVMDDIAEEGEKKFKIFSLKWNFQRKAFDLISTLSLKDENYGHTPYHDLTGFYWLEHKSSPYILYFNGPNTIKVVTQHHKRLVDISKRKGVRKAFDKLIPELFSNMSFTKNSSSRKRKDLKIYGVSSTFSSHSPIVTRIILELKLR